MSCNCECGAPRHRNPCGCACECACGANRDENRPGLDTVTYRDGAYDAALRRMRERLSGADLPALRALTARAIDESVDPAIALLDGWACLSEVLSFYNERAVNESFLRTCTERRSALELARLVGYAPRPGVSADAYLAFTLDDLNKEAVLEIPTGTRAYSQPGPGETMQPFETDEVLRGRPRWSAMRPRLTMPQTIVADMTELWFKGITTGLVPGSVLLFELGEEYMGRAVSRVQPIPKGSISITKQLPTEDQTLVTLQQPKRDDTPSVSRSRISEGVLSNLILQPGRYAASRERLALDPQAIFEGSSYAPVSLLGAAYPGLRESLGAALGGTTPQGPTGVATVYAMRVKAAIHGHNAPLFANVNTDGVILSYMEWNVDGTEPFELDEGEVLTEFTGTLGNDLNERQIALDSVYDGILPGSLIAIVRPPTPVNENGDGDVDIPGTITPLSFGRESVYRVIKVETVSRARYNLPARVTLLTLNREWRTGDDVKEGFGAFRQITVYAQSEALELADRPIADAVADDRIVLNGYYEGLQPGRRMIVTGARTDLDDITGVQAAELVMVTAVTHEALDDTAWATTDTIHTYLTLAPPGLRYEYARETVTIYGNVAHASHGESRAEVLGSGDATRALQQFQLKQTPLTYVPAPTSTGIANTLDVRVNDLRWREAPNAAAIAADERRYILCTNDDAQTSLIFGMGARLPTGRENVRAVYRSGIGAAGNVRAGQISVLASQPNGVMGVTNPLATSGGADRDNLSQVRTRAPIGLAALDRLVSAGDFVDFTRAFAGIGKAGVSFPNPGVLNLQLTIAGENDIPIGDDSALMRNLTEALSRYGDLISDPLDPTVLRTRNVPVVTVTIRLRSARLVALRARIRLLPDFLWEAVLPKVEAAVFSSIGFNARELGQPLDPGETIATIQNVRGVAFVDLQQFGAIDIGSINQPRTPEEIAGDALALLGGVEQPGMPPLIDVDPTEIVYLAPRAAGTLLLTPWEED